MYKHAVAREMQRACRAEGEYGDVEGTEPEGEDEDEMDNFQELHLGTLTPLVCLEEFDVAFLSTDDFGQDMNRIFEL